MRKRLSKKESWFKENILTAQDEIYVGIDVHKDQYHVAIWHNDRIGCIYSMSSDNNKLLRDLRRIRNSLKNVVYEAGPTGYGLVRLLRSAGLSAEVVATSKTPRSADSTAKTDRLDCKQLAEYTAKGLLTFVSIPTEQQEADRQVVRLRDQLISKRKRIMQQIKGFLLQHSIAWPGHCWGKAVVGKLRAMDLASGLRFTLDQYLDEYEFLSGKIAQTNSRLGRIFSSRRHSAARCWALQNSGHAFITSTKSVGLLFSLLSSLSELVTLIVLGLSSVDTSEGLFCDESTCSSGVVTTLFLADLGVV